MAQCSNSTFLIACKEKSSGETTMSSTKATTYTNTRQVYTHAQSRPTRQWTCSIWRHQVSPKSQPCATWEVSFRVTEQNIRALIWSREGVLIKVMYVLKNIAFSHAIGWLIVRAFSEMFVSQLIMISKSYGLFSVSEQTTVLISST